MKEVLLTSSVLIVAVLILRCLFRNSISRRVQYALWGLVLLRLLVPVSIGSLPVNVLSAAQPAVEQVRDPVVTYVGGETLQLAPIDSPDFTPAEHEAAWEEWRAEMDAARAETGTPVRLSDVLTAVWLAGAAVMLCWLVVSNLRFWRKLRKGRAPYAVEGCRRRVWLVEEGLSTPCLFGLFRPAIYLTPAAVSDPASLRHVIAHEETHAQHLDPLWSLLRGVCLAVYWFDPLVWCAAIVSRADCELACDEGTLCCLGEGERLAYGQTLLSLIPVLQKPANPLLSATTMAAGKRQLKERILRIAEHRGTVTVALFAVVVAAALVCVATFTGAAARVDITLEPAQTEKNDPSISNQISADRDRMEEDERNAAAAPDKNDPEDSSGDGKEQEERNTVMDPEKNDPEGSPGDRKEQEDTEPSSADPGGQTGNPSAESQTPDQGGSAAQNECVITRSALYIDEDDMEGSGKSIVLRDAAELRGFLGGLEYHSYTCDGIPEYEISFGDGTAYQVNLSSRWVWQRGAEREAVLSAALLAELQALMGIDQTAAAYQATYKTGVGLGPNTSQCIPFPVGVYNYWSITIQNNGAAALRFTISRDSPAGEIVYTVPSPVAANATERYICTEPLPYDHTYCILVYSNDGSQVLDGTLWYQFAVDPSVFDAQ